MEEMMQIITKYMSIVSYVHMLNEFSLIADSESNVYTVCTSSTDNGL